MYISVDFRVSFLILSIVITFLLDNVWILLGEVSCSLVGVKGRMQCHVFSNS